MLSRLETKESTLHVKLYLSKIKGPISKKNNFARVSRFFVSFFVVVVARPQCETS